MKLFWNEQKNTLLKMTRNIGFEEVQEHIDNGFVYHLEAHPNQMMYPHQHILYFEKR